MGKHMKLVLGLALSVSCAVQAAETKGMVWSGNFTSGYHHTWKAGAGNASGFLVDRMKMRLDGTVSDRVKLVLQKAFFIHSVGQETAGLDTFDSKTFTSPANVRLDNASGFALALEGAYIDHKCADGWHTWFGFFATPFGMETMWDRYDMHTYYYSGFMQNTFYGRGLSHDLGVKIALTDIIPGSLEFAVLDGRYYNGGDNHLSPAVALRYSMESKSGDMSFTPVISAYLGRFSGFAKLWAASAGVMGKFGALSTNLEFLYGQDQKNIADDAATNGKDKSWSVYVEPGFDFGMANLSVKAELMNQDLEGGAANDSVESITDYNIGAAISHTYEGNFNVKVAYQHTGLNGKVATPHVNDFRVLFSTKW